MDRDLHGSIVPFTERSNRWTQSHPIQIRGFAGGMRLNVTDTEAEKLALSLLEAVRKYREEGK